MPRQPRPINPDVRAILERACDLLSDQGRWCTGVLAQTRTGRKVLPQDPRAEQWCAVGAMQRAAWELLEADHTCPSPDELVNEARIVVLPIARTIAASINPHYATTAMHSEITQINDLPHFGGWGAIVNAFRTALGRGTELDGEVLHRVELAIKRSEAAHKGWETRMRRRLERLRAMSQPEPQPQPEPTMTFGGTVVSPPINADAKEVAV